MTLATGVVIDLACVGRPVVDMFRESGQNPPPSPSRRVIREAGVTDTTVIGR